MEQSILDHLLSCIAERRCSLRELADKSGVPYDTVTKIAQRKQIPRLDTAEKLLKCFPSRAASLAVSEKASSA